MALFKRPQKNPPPPPISFEGQEPLGEMDFRHEYENLLEALTLQEIGKSRWRSIGGSLVLLVLGALAVPQIYAFSPVWAVLAVILGILLVIHGLFGNAYTRSYTAKKMAEEEKDHLRHLKIYKNGISVTEKGEEFGAPYRLMKMYESDRQFTVLFGTQKMLAFPKKDMGEKLPLYREIFAGNLGQRFFETDGKGRIIVRV